MDQTHIGYTYWQEPPRNVMPRVDVIQMPTNADMGVAIVEQNRATPPMGRGGPPPGFVLSGGRGATLPPFDIYAQQTYHVDVYNKGKTPFTYTSSADAVWLKVLPATGTITKESRLSVSIDWTRVPAGTQRASLTIAGPNNAKSVIQAVVHNPSSPKRDDVVGFVQSNGYVSMEAEHFTRAVTGSAPGASDALGWQVIPGLGRTLSGVTAWPVTAPTIMPSAGTPRLEYNVFLTDSGSVKVHTFLSPTLNFAGSATGPRFAVSLDDETPQIVAMIPDTTERAWEKSVGENIRILTSRHEVKKPGAHTLKFWRVDPGVVLQKVVIETTNLPSSYLGPPESFYRPAKTGSN